MLRFLLTLLLVCTVVYVMYENIRTKKEYHERQAVISSIFMDDVLARAEEADDTRSALRRYRKYREAHASLESIAAIAGGHDRLTKLVDHDVRDFDRALRVRENESFATVQAQMDGMVAAAGAAAPPV